MTDGSVINPRKAPANVFNKHYDNAYMEHRFQTMSMDPSQSSRV